MTDFSKANFSPSVVVEYLRQSSQLKEIYKQLLTQRIVRQKARAKNLLVTPEEIQAEAEHIRRRHHLEKASDTFAWLSDQLMDAEDWEAGVYSSLLEKKVMENLFAADVEKVFSQNKLNFERVVLYQLQVADFYMAQELRYQILEKEYSFYEVARRYDTDTDRCLRCGYEGMVSRWQLAPAVAAAIFGTPPGRIIGPLKLDSSYHLFMAESFIPTQLTDEVRQEILKNLFDEWLEPEMNHMLYSDFTPVTVEPIPA